MKKPHWLSLDAVLAMHEQLVAEHGGSIVLRDRGLLESALVAAQKHFAYGQRDLFKLAAVYAHGLSRNHPFVDGNKRIAFLASFVFLDINGWELRAEEPQVVEIVLNLAARRIDEDSYAEWLRQKSARKLRAAKPSRPQTKKGKRGVRAKKSRKKSS